MADDCRKAREIAAWKELMSAEWNNIRVISATSPDASYVLSPTDLFRSEVRLDLGRIKPEDVGVELIFTTADAKGKLHIQEVCNLDYVGTEDNIAIFKAAMMPERTGMYQVGTRVFPKNAALPHRQDFPLVKWL